MAQRSVNERFADLEVERSALGMAMLGQTADLQDAHLSESAFSLPEHGLVWRACVGVLEEGGEPEPLTVDSWLMKHEYAGWTRAKLAELSSGVPRRSAANLLWVVGRLEELAASRAIREADEVFAKAVQTNPDFLVDGTVDRHIEALDRIRQERQHTTPWLDADQQWDALKGEAKRSAEGAVLLGLNDLDVALDGVKPGEVLGLMARPGMGKTVMLCHQARWMAHAGLAHVVFSLEMPAPQIVTRLAQAEYELSRHQVLDRMRVGALDGARYREVFASLRIVDRGGLSVSEMASRLRRLQDREFRGRQIRAVTIDHLGLIGGDRKLSTYDRVSVQTREIKEIAKAFNVAVILAVQVNREAGGDGS
jgi:replicative DNA helicase